MKFITKQIKSNYLQEEYDVSCWEMKQRDRTLIIIEHAALEDIVFNNLHIEGFRYDLIPIAGVSNHPVVKCVMEDGNGRRIVAIGEAHPSSLINEISRQNPTIMAGNRAFDRAAIRYLDLDGKVYSSEEIQDNNEENEPDTNVKTAQDDNCNKPVCNTAPEVKDKSNSDAETHPGDVVINFGKYRGKNMTVAQICDSDDSWVEYTINMNTDSCGNATLKQIEALRTYKKGA